MDLMLEKRLRGFVGCESHTLDVWELLILIEQKELPVVLEHLQNKQMHVEDIESLTALEKHEIMQK